jgi:hypothetical protein
LVLSTIGRVIVSDLTIALAGGAIGSILTVGAGLMRRAAAVPSEVERNDADAAERNDDLMMWVADHHRQLGAELTRTRNEMAAAGQQYSGAYPQSMAQRKSQALRCYRDQERQARRDVAIIRAREDWMHHAYRRLKQLSAPQLNAPQRAEPVLNSWRKPVIVADASVPVHDPTAHTLEDTISGLTGSSP